MVSAHTVKDSISSFTFQRMALMDDFDCDACGSAVEGVWDLVQCLYKFCWFTLFSSELL
jgi:hypothetical protein